MTDTRLWDSNIDCMGHYTVGNRIFREKVAALAYATQINSYAEWVFNNEAFNRFNWAVEPTESLDELYRQRAQEIRDTYKYVALSYSGGADSHQVLMAFLDNNITLDEVIVTWPVRRSETLGANPGDFSATNYMSEWQLAIKPRLKWLKDHYPNIRITINDWAENLDNVALPDDLLMTRSNMLSIYAFLRYNKVSDVGRIHGKEGVIIFGIDKPRVCIHNNYYNILFLDVVAQSSVVHLDDSVNVNELFYWSPKCCKLLAKQAHIVANYSESNLKFKNLLHWPQKASMRQTYEVVVKKLVYPSTDTTQFQTVKPLHPNISKDAVVFDSDLEDRYLKAYDRNWDTLKSVIDSRFFHQHVDGHTTLIGCINGMWKIKPAL